MSWCFSLILAWMQSLAIWSLGLLTQEFILPFLKQKGWVRDWAGLCLQLGVSLSALPILGAIKILCHENDHVRAQVDGEHFLFSCNFLGNPRKEM